MDWTVTIEAVGPAGSEAVGPDVGDSLAEALPNAVGHARANRYGASFEVDAATVRQALDRALEAWARVIRQLWLPRWPLERLDVVTTAEHDRLLAEAARPEVVGLTEVSALLGVSRLRATELVRQEGFPRPVAELDTGPVWVLADVATFRQQWSDRARRPREETVHIVRFADGWRTRRADEAGRDETFGSRTEAIARAQERLGHSSGTVVVEEPGGAVTTIRIVDGEAVQRDTSSREVV